MGQTTNTSSRAGKKGKRIKLAAPPEAIKKKAETRPVAADTALNDEKVLTKAYRQLLEKITRSGSKIDTKRVHKAFRIAKEAHKHQRRSSGEPYMIHPLAVAEILVELNLDTDTIVTALLHDTVEDTTLTIEDIEEKFGARTAALVSGVTKLAKIEYQPDHVKQAENFRKLLLAISEDIRVLLVKLADRVHNMRTLSHITDPAKRLEKARETMDIYAPLAERIGIHKFKNELQDLAFAETNAEMRTSIISRASFLRDSGGEMIERIQESLKQTLEEHGIKAVVFGREKTSFSIWKKMESKRVSFEQISDVVGFRVLVNDIPSCYLALGAIHGRYHSISTEFKDYISTPKSNGYMSLHTVIIGPGQRSIEVQIRTQHMNEVAELGVAAHWAYKQNCNEPIEGAQYRWLRELLLIVEKTASPEEFLENTKLEMFYDQVFCFSPKGDLIALPRGSTPVDFAFAVHSSIGLSCVGARVNGKVAPLRCKLENGDQVEILRGPEPSPSPFWEGFVITGKARAEIRRFIKGKQSKDQMDIGEALFKKCLEQSGREDAEQATQEALRRFKRKTRTDMIMGIGQGSIKKEEVIEILSANSTAKAKKKGKKSNVFAKKKRYEEATETAAVLVDGDIPTQSVKFARCCSPIPGDRIVGIRKTRQELTVHVVGCSNLEKYTEEPDDWADVSWGNANKNTHIESVLPVKIMLILANEIGSLSAITTTIATLNANITDIIVTGNWEDFCGVNVCIFVKGTHHLANIIDALKALSCVHSAERVRYSPEYPAD
ncbi:MAG: bifunctional (p)ppGpp synthetase/guanosine-3',5'-bis(diphosphate) 3'-pyrophosphohydrolase [Proteobacteria bacterium]|nr:bifunctional (p)ppGpp synthetase/guanosine-3',5'-bis(diphosphate) 3'-pyrophosphohydrolase [Pseudomonadota bacterium]